MHRIKQTNTKQQQWQRSEHTWRATHGKALELSINFIIVYTQQDAIYKNEDNFMFNDEMSTGSVYIDLSCVTTYITILL
jgi:hypothetical protein